MNFPPYYFLNVLTYVDYEKEDFSANFLFERRLLKRVIAQLHMIMTTMTLVHNIYIKTVSFLPFLM